MGVLYEGLPCLQYSASLIHISHTHILPCIQNQITKENICRRQALRAPEHQRLRLCIYRELVFWIYTVLQCKEKGPLPSYLVLKVRATFPPTQDEELFADWLTGLWESWWNHVVNCEEISGLNDTWDKPWIVLLVRLLTSAYHIERPLALFSSILQLSANYN